MNPDEALAAAIADRTEAATRRSRIETAQKRLEETRAVLAQKSAVAASEETDVEKLEHLSWTSVVARLKGQYASAVERKTAERDAARYARREAEIRHQQAEAELAAATSRLDELGDTEGAYARALATKEEWARSRPSGEGARLDEIAERRGLLEAERREIDEAATAGAAAHERLLAALEQLSSAGSWATWDTFGGGGLITDMVKRGKMDAAVDQMRAAELSLRRFATELADLNVQAIKPLDLGFALGTFDIWFDNIFSDWAVRNRIKDADERVRDVAVQVRSVLDGLRQRDRDVSVELDGLSRERERLLTA